MGHARGRKTMLVRGRALVAALMVVFAGLTGCATRDQYIKMRRELNQVRRMLADTQSDVQAQQRQIQALAGDADLGRVSSLGTFEQGSLESRVSVLESVVQERLGAELPQPMPGAAEPGATVVTGPAGAEQLGAEIAALRGQTPGEDEYRAALALVEQQDYAEAIPRLRSYLRKYPDTALSDNAQYWIGECYYAQRDFNNAILAFYDVTRRYPKGDKVCAAMLKQGFAFAELGDAADARIVLERLVQTHPSCGEVTRARAKLATLRQG
jgi:tol-pal system protein YbgF